MSRPSRFTSFLCFCLPLALIACGPSIPSSAPQEAAPPPLSKQRAGEVGLEMVTFAVSMDEVELGRALLPFEAGNAIDPLERDRWRRAGLRVLAIPMDDLPTVRAAIDARSGLRHRWLGEPARWTALLAGPASPRLINDGEGPTALGQGRLRLLARAWTRPTIETEPASRVAAGLRLEMVPQHRPGPDPVRTLGLQRGVPVGNRALQEGVLFRRLALAADLDGSRALLIVPADPDTDWQALAEAPPARQETAPTQSNTIGPEPDDISSDEPAAGPGPFARDTAPLPREPRSEPFGPSPSRGTALGMGMLSTDPGGARAGRSPRVAILLIPHVPERFTLGPLARRRETP